MGWMGSDRRRARRHANLSREAPVFALELEPRYMFDAAALATGAEVADQADALPPDPAPADDGGAADHDRAVEQALAEWTPPATDDGGNAAPKDVVFIDASVGDHDTLGQAARDGAEVVLLSADRPALTQIADYLEGRSGLDAVHIISHGATGSLAFGSGTIDAAALADHAAQLDTIGEALTDDGDILLYGCYVGANGDGQAFLDALAEATGADVAASDDPTGASDLGGDWDLEVAVGPVEAPVAFRADAITAYSGLLPVYDFASGTITGGGLSSTVTQDIGGEVLKATESRGKLLISTFGEPDSYLIVGGGGSASFQITLNDGALFSVGNIVWQSGETKTYEIAGWIGQTEDASTFVGTMNATGTFSALSGTYDRLVFKELSPGTSNISLFLNTIDLTPKSDTVAPILNTNAAKTLAEGATTALSNTNLAATDNLYGAADITYTVTAGPSQGTLYIDGVGGSSTVNGAFNGETAVTTFTQADLDSGKVLYVHNGSETTSDSFTVRLSDPKPNTSATATFNLSITPVNDLPQLGGTPADATVTEDVTTAIDLSAYNVTDVDSASVTLTLAVDRGTIASTDGNGTLAGVTVTNSGTTSMTLAGSKADVNTYLNDTSKITFTTDANDTTTATLTVTPNDGSDNGTADTVSITVTPVNDAPTGGTSSVSATEDTPYTLATSDFTFSDPDSGDSLQAVRVDALPGSGTLFLDANGNDALDGGEAVTVSQVIDLATMSAGQLKYLPPADQNGTGLTDFSVSVGDGTLFAASPATVTIDVAAVNDAPVLAGLDGTPTFVEGGAAVILDGTVTVSDTELDARNAGAGNYAGASVTVARSGGANTDDSFSIQTGGSLTVAGTNISSGGSVFATIDTTTTAGQVTVTFTDANGTTPTTALVNEVMQAIRYANGSDDPPATMQLDWTFNDGNAGLGDQGAGDAPGTGSGAVAVAVSAINDAPTLTATGDDPGFIEGGADAGLFSSASADAQEVGDTFAGLTLTVTNVTDGAHEILSIDGTDVALTDTNSVSVAGGTATVSLSGTDATVTVTGLDRIQAQFEALVNGLAYRNTSDDPTTASGRVVTITRVQDGGGTANGGTDAKDTAIASTVTLTPVNDPPVVGNVFDETSTVVAGAGAQNVALFDDATVSNPDSANYNGGVLSIRQTIGTANGSWGLDSSIATSDGDGTIAAGETVAVDGVTVGDIGWINDGADGQELTIYLTDSAATSPRLQTLLQALTYNAPSSLGDRTFTLSLRDDDGMANGGDRDTSGTFTISVTQDPPVIGNLDGDTTAAGNGATVAFDLNGDATVSDPDSANFGGGVLEIARTSGLGGTFSLTGTGSNGVSSGLESTNADGTIERGHFVYVDGVLVGINHSDATAGTLSITLEVPATPARVQALIRALQYTSTEGGAHTFDVTLRDGLSAGAATSDVAKVTINVGSVPVNTVPGAQTAVDGTAKAITGISVADADSATVTTTVSAATGQGTFTASGAGTITGAGTHSIQISGAIGDVNAALANLQYTPAVDSSGAQTITVATTDGTNTDTDTITVTVSDRPTIANLDGDSQTGAVGTATALDAGGNAAVSDNDSADFNGGTLTLSRVNGTLEGDLSLNAGAATSGGDGIIAAGETIMVGGTAIGTVNAGSDGQGTNALSITLNGNATPARVATLLQALQYTPITDSGSHAFDVTVTDDGGHASAASRTSIVIPADTATTDDGGHASTASRTSIVIPADTATTDDGGHASTASRTLIVIPADTATTDPVVPVFVQTRGPVTVVTVQTPTGVVILASAPQSLSGSALGALFQSMETGNTPLSQAFLKAVSGAGASPLSQSFQSALGEALGSAAWGSLMGDLSALYYFDGQNWQLLDLTIIDEAFGDGSGAAPGDGLDLDGLAPAAAGAVADLGLLLEDRPARLGPPALDEALAEAAFGFERETARLAAALATVTPPAARA